MLELLNKEKVWLKCLYKCDCWTIKYINFQSVKRWIVKSCWCYWRKVTKEWQISKALNRKTIKHKDYIELELTWWEYTKLDYEDYEKIKLYKWYKSLRWSVESRINYKLTKIYRLIMNAKDWEIIDHISWDTLDNRKENLRICTIIQNCWNSKIQKNNKSWIRNIRFNVKMNRWIVDITTKFKKTVKRFISKEDAISFLELLKKERWGYNRR